MSKEGFVMIVNALRDQAKWFFKLEDALGTSLELAYRLQSKILDAVEHEMGCGNWDYKIYGLIYSDDKNPEEIYDLIKEVQNNEIPV